MDRLIADKEVLEATADIIERYCKKQTTVMDEYLDNISALASVWQDDKTFGSLIQEVRFLKNNVAQIMDEIITTYPKYFRTKAIELDNR